MTTWQQDMTRTIGEQVRELRDGRTALWLSERTAELGMKISRSAISELEGGKRRSISVAEWLTLAAALEVPPGLLLFPGYPDRTVNYLPGQESSSHDAVSWVGGQMTNDPEFGIVDQASSLVAWSRGRSKVREQLLHLRMRLDTESFETEAERTELQKQIEEKEKMLRIGTREIKRHGGVVDDG